LEMVIACPPIFAASPAWDRPRSSRRRLKLFHGSYYNPTRVTLTRGPPIGDRVGSTNPIRVTIPGLPRRALPCLEPSRAAAAGLPDAGVERKIAGSGRRGGRPRQRR
jgi:hypothetical protein